MQVKRLLRLIGLLALVLMRAQAPAPSQAQFSAPYDPDFAAPPSPGKPAAAEETGPGPSTDASPATGLPAEPGAALGTQAQPFLLLERANPEELLERPAPLEPETEDADFVDFEHQLKAFEYRPSQYDEVKSRLERGLPATELPPPGPREFAPVVSAAPKPPPPEVELPAYGTSLSITGRKVIGFQFSQKRFLNEQTKSGRAASTNLIEINQQLQLRMQGKVGPKITVNVDYDDTKQNHQDISVVYTGDPNEVVQNVSFGDIDLSLPATEFVSYNKQLFGIRADVKYKGFKGSVIASRTKGTTKSKQFFGNTQFVAIDLLDTSYLRRQYYDLTFGLKNRLPLKPGSERVFLARQEVRQANVNDLTLTADDLVVASSTFTGTFTQLSPGQDYTMDYAKGVINFRTQLQPQFVVAVDFIDASGNSITVETSSTSLAVGGTGRFKLIKTASDIPIALSTETGYNRELKTFYSIGQTQIVRDNGRGNFILKVLDQNRNEVGPSLNPVQKYPESIFVDFENGIFQLQNPFAVLGDSSTADPDVYAPTPISKRLLHVEYNYRFKTFFLEPNLVPQSEVVLLDGIKLNRNVDYFIDYEAGFITFFNEDRIRAQSEIDITYEVAPFAGVTNESLLGTRVSYDFNPHFSLGSTLLYQAGTKSPTVPTVSELARSLLVYEFDSQVKNVKLLPNLIASFSGEYAQSRQNLNLNSHALIDNMEGIKQEDTASTLAQQWYMAANPGARPTDPTKVNWLTEDVKVLEINPRAQAGSQETQKVLDLNYDFTNTLSTEASIVYPFSTTGMDFSQKTLLEVVMLGDNSNNEIDFHLGGVNEDADGDGVFDTEDANNDGILQPSEDIGWLYNPAGKPSTRLGAGNGRIDTEDLNANGRLDPDDFSGDDFGYSSNTVTGNNFLFNATDSSTHSFINFGGGTNWKVFQIPLNISTATASRWTNIKQLRISLRRRNGGNNVGTMKFARIAVIGNTWQRGQALDPATNAPAVASESMTVTPVNNVDNPNYTPIFNAGGDATQVFNDLYGNLASLQKQSGSKNLSEQALQLEFVGMSTGAVVTTKRLFTRAIDISQHRAFNFLLFGNADLNNVNNADHEFFLRVGNDANFFEVRVPLNYTGWKKIQVVQADTNGDSIADAWKAKTAGTVVVSSGTPSLQQVASLVAGVRSLGVSGAGTTRGRAYLNEIHLAEPVARTGTAKKIEMAFEVPGWATFGGKYREVDRNFQTPTSVVSNQDRREDSAYLNFTRMPYFPMTFNLSRSITDTPSTFQTGDLSNFVNLLQQGKVTSWTGSAQGNFALGAYPRVSLSHVRNRVEYSLLTRLDDRKTYSGTLQYGVPWQSRWLPRTIDANYSHSRYDVSFESLAARRVAGNFNTNEFSNTVGTRLTFAPWEGSSFNPNYSLTKVHENRSDFTGAAERNLRYPKSMNQTVGFTSNFKVTSWLNPQFNYSIDTIENNILSVSTFVVGASTHVFDVGQIKTINRSANGSMNLPIALGDIFSSRLLRSMNIASGYQIQDGDVWNNVESGLSSQYSLWIRTPLRPKGPAAVRQNQTLRDTFNSTQRWSPLEAFDLRGRKSAFRTLSLSNNFVRSIQRTDVTGTPSKTISTTFPDAVANISQLEQLWRTESWMSNTQINFKYSAHRVETVGQTINTDQGFGTDLRSIVRRRFDTLLSYNWRAAANRNLLVDANTQKTGHEDATAQVTFDVGKFRFTPKTDYTHDTTSLGTGVRTQDVTVVTPSLLVRADLALPRGLRLPGSSKTLLFSNRIIWTTTMALAERSSPITIADNSRLFTLNTSGDYEIAKNLRMTLNGSMSRLWHRFLKEEDFISYQFGTTLTFQF
ncbi:MAG: hypothetical protein HY921_12845 [Elusimicrobia bacterium]|nr:hypothetical protein [Elusimicrobiota bacterium]